MASENSESKPLDNISNSSSDGCLDDIDLDDDYEDVLGVPANDPNWHARFLMTFTMGSATYFHNYLLKEHVHDRKESGWSYLMSMINGRDTRCRKNLRMSPEVFMDLCKTLVDHYGLKLLPYVTVEEQVATFLMSVGPAEGNRQMQEFLQRSGFTVSRSFHRVLKALTKMSIDWVRTYHDMNVTHPYVRENSKYYPHFKDCVGAINSAHIPACLPQTDQIPYIGRKGNPTQTVMAACDFDMLFTYVLPGWEGSTHDTRIFYDTIRDKSKEFPMPPSGKYYLVDAGYPNIEGFMAPYKGVRYHLPDFQRNATYRNHFESLNHVHSSLRTTIERTFAVWKNKFSIMKNMPINLKFQDQVALVSATMALHNFIRLHDREDEDFLPFDCEPEDIPEEELDLQDNSAAHGLEIQSPDARMNLFRDNICTSITFERIGIPIRR